MCLYHIFFSLEKVEALYLKFRLEFLMTELGRE